VRISSRLEWIDEPNFASAALIKSNYKDNISEMLKFYAKWAPTKIEEYKRTKEYEVPTMGIIDDVDDGSPPKPADADKVSPLDEDDFEEGNDEGRNATATNSTDSWETHSKNDSGWDDYIPWSSQEKTPIKNPSDNIKPEENLDDWDADMNSFNIKPASALFLM
jgi:hypothetical protein